MKKEINKPVKVFRVGSISASVFKNESKESGSFYRISFSRSYRVNDEFKTATTFAVSDLPTVCSLAQQAFLFVAEIESQQ